MPLVPRIPVFFCALPFLVAHAFGYRQGFSCGDDQTRTMPDGAVYAADRVYSPENESGRIGGDGSRARGIIAIGGTEQIADQELLGSLVEGWREYRFDLPDGDYVIHFHFLESEHHWRGLRSFSIAAEDEPLFVDLDIFARVDRRYGLSARRAVRVSDGRLNVQALASIDASILSGIYVENYIDDRQAPPPPDEILLRPSYNEVLIFIDRAWARDELGVHIWRTDLSAGGEPQRITDDPVVFDRYRDLGLDPSHAYEYRFSAVDAGGNESELTSPVVISPLAEQDSALPLYGFEALEEDLITLYTERSRDDYQSAFVWIGAEEWSDAGVRLRGNTTRGKSKKNHKLRTSPSRPFPGGRTKLNLQAEWAVPTPLREKLSFDYFALAGGLASHAQYVNFMRLDEFIGVYVDLEQVDRYLLDSRGLSGTIWRADTGAGDFLRKPSLEHYYKAYLLEHGRYSDYEYLDELFAIVNETSPEEFRTAIPDVMDIDSFMRFYAVQAIISNLDHVLHNYFLFRDETTGLFCFAPWDLQWSWERINHPIIYGTREYPNFRFCWNRLYDKLMTSPQYARIYSVTLAELIQNELSLETMIQTVERDHALVRPDVYRDMHKLFYEKHDAFDAALEGLLDFLERRVPKIWEQLAAFAPPPTVNLFLNEIVRRNETGARDEMGEIEPWVEIYNFGNETLDLSGLGLSQSAGDPFEWIFPEGIEIESESHLLVWLDGEPAEGPLHASFRAVPGLPALYFNDRAGEEIDRLIFRLPGFADVSEARTPDGGERVVPVASPTPGSSNDLRPAVEIQIFAPAHCLPGDAVLVELSIHNHTPLAIQVRVLMVLIVGEVERLLGKQEVELLPGKNLMHEMSGEIPWRAPAIEIALRATLKSVVGGVLLDSDQAPLRIWDAKPIPLVINEVMADNDTTVKDENGQYEDWIEIHNPSDRVVSLDGLYLSDDISDPTAWPCPPVKIQPGEYVLFWCDDDEDQGPLHTDFKLSAGGEEIGLFDLDVRGNQVIDLTAFDDLSNDRVWGRQPDAVGDFQLLPWATPGEPNP